MKNGYYLSVYSEVDPVANMLQISQRHDHNMALWYKEAKRVTLLRHWELERFTGFKQHSIAFFSRDDYLGFIQKRLAEYGLSLVDIVEIFGDPCPSERSACLAAVHQYPDISNHAIFHLYASLLSDTKLFHNETVVALAMDGAPDIVLDGSSRDKKYYCGAVSIRGNIEVFPVASPGMYWTAATRIFHLREGTLMALASASESVTLENDFFVDKIYDRKSSEKVFLQIQKLADRIMAYSAEDAGIKFSGFDPRFSEEENKISMVMKLIQTFSIHVVEEEIDAILQKYGLRGQECVLSLGGGYALNCPTNTYLMQKYQFKNFLSVPCVSDSGLSVGIGLYSFYRDDPSFEFQFENAFYGNAYPAANILCGERIRSFIDSVSDQGDPVQDLMDGPIVWYDGQSESGPRALGHRSIIADPRSIRNKDLINLYKQRQWWRPVAPIILEDFLEEWFENAYPSPYMLNNFVIRQEKKELVPAILHLDLTASVQTINQESDEALYHVIQNFYERTGIPIVCNTSLNDRGEPIIETVEQAFNFALRKKIEVVYVDGLRVKLKNHLAYELTEPLTRDESEFSHYTGSEKLMEQYNPFHLNHTEYYLYKFYDFMSGYDIRKETDARKIKRMCKKINDLMPLKKLVVDFLKSSEKQMNI